MYKVSEHQPDEVGGGSKKYILYEARESRVLPLVSNFEESLVDLKEHEDEDNTSALWLQFFTSFKYELPTRIIFF